MEDLIEKQKRDLQEKILAKRQQVEFEKTDIDMSKKFSADNTQNPDVSEEFKNFNDPASNVIENGELVELSKSEKELIDLIDKLNKLNKEL
ncbi:hypothetical protein [Dyadobacter psychrotolerans]|uniref:Uncharacterized protein n=1 Tax=Dyadobacter psychrotolerans TaxID=2541721 RepID=A0A4R5DTJ7_9BACT|nr:hypothetical protein [Dyadobacter psychrotolerans]TDE15411.1 hypothetical protein E0F88_12935 [Dyadobacter psychrotolerans]